MIAFTPATVKERKDDPFDKDLPQKAVTLAKRSLLKLLLCCTKRRKRRRLGQEMALTWKWFRRRPRDENRPRGKQMLSRPLLFNERQQSGGDGKCGGTTVAVFVVKEYGTHQPQNVELCSGGIARSAFSGFGGEERKSNTARTRRTFRTSCYGRKSVKALLGVV